MLAGQVLGELLDQELVDRGLLDQELVDRELLDLARDLVCHCVA